MTETVAAEAPQKPALHHSMISMLSKCGEMFRWRYIEGIKSPPGVAMVIGTAVHRAAQADLEEKMASGSGMPLDAVREKARASLLSTWDGEEPVLDDEEKTQGIAVVRGAAVDSAVALSALHSKEITPKRNPTHVERRLRVSLDGFPFDLEGSLDVQEGDELIVDRKTAAKSPSASVVEGAPQLEIYAAMKKIVDGTPVKRVGLDFLIKTATPKALTLTADAPVTFESILARVERAALVIQKEAFMPVDPSGPSGWVCQSNWCGYFDRCAFGARRRKQFAVGGAS